MDANIGNRGRARGVRIRGGGRGGRGRGQGRGRPRTVISDEIRATLVDHVVNHGLTMREAGQRVQPNLSRYTVASIIRTFRNENRTERLPTQGGRERLLSPEQETEIINMVLENNAITLRQIQRKILQNNEMFQNIDRVSLSTLDRVLRRNNLRMKQVYRVPFERNSERVKELRHNYVQRVLELEVAAVEHQFIFTDEVGFNLIKKTKEGKEYHRPACHC
ncbi:uncharacterized protein LOC118495027 [Sander lucioperca]|uniref:uncharacterized protein LOC118495027 n=1 Tax=Sander lucioperca TaxID=283035 RepID=UPI001653DB39|nr:uncharacterized protein LOC118495027 [Sander lucioperca]